GTGRRPGRTGSGRAAGTCSGVHGPVRLLRRPGRGLHRGGHRADAEQRFQHRLRRHRMENASDGSAGRAWRAERAQRRTPRIRRLWDFFEGGNPYTNYWLVLGATFALAAMGLTMVLSSTSVNADGQAF